MIGTVIFFAATSGFLVWASRSTKTSRRSILRFLLVAGKPTYGLDLVERRIAGRGSVYIALSQLEDEGLVRSWPEDRPGHPGLPRRMYELTPLGITAARALVNTEGPYR